MYLMAAMMACNLEASKTLNNIIENLNVDYPHTYNITLTYVCTYVEINCKAYLNKLYELIDLTQVSLQRRH